MILRCLGAGGAVMLLLATWLAPAKTAHAADGVLEINQTCATTTGCFSGDAPGLPVSITTSGSYVLTSNLTMPDANTSGIAISVNAATVDLNGFSIEGPTTCTPGVGCASTGAGIGISGNTGGNRQETTIRNGVIRGMGFYGIFCDRGCTVENMRLESNGDAAIVMNNGVGIIRDNIIRNNGSYGIYGRGVITGNAVEQNGDVGIWDNARSTVRNNDIVQNAGSGLRCNRCLATDNVISNNDGWGAVIFGNVAFGRNVLSDNDLGTIDVGGGNLHEVDPNVCATNLVCP